MEVQIASGATGGADADRARFVAVREAQSDAAGSALDEKKDEVVTDAARGLYFGSNVVIFRKWFIDGHISRTFFLSVKYRTQTK